MSKSEACEKDILEVLRKYNMKISYNLGFPMYKYYPDEVKLALGILKKHNMRVVITIEDK